MTPKSLLRLPEAKSRKEDFTRGEFNEIIDDDIENKSSVKRIIVTSGKVYYDLAKYRSENKIADTAILRLEQYYPYLSNLMREFIGQYKNAKDIVWVQEEPRNMGAWNFLAILLKNDLSKKQKLYCVSPEESASPAAGSLSKFIEEHNEVLRLAFSGEIVPVF
jgi:2-oxoglutarate dehydrogenase E1 component